MDYIDIYNIPENAIESYTPAGEEVTPDLSDGLIFRIPATGNFNLERLKNQVDGVKFFVEVINNSGGDIIMSFDNDYRAPDLGFISPVTISSGAIEYYEMICRIGLMIVYAQEGIEDSGYLRNPADGFILLNPATGQPLINPGA